ncbi:hypothetical protein [Halalkalicoccus salilacus]|uniref:hypothetical protein n=1 Tax=Halalkalicoccus sp. GCM10025704 TaxID=3252662 RepID=UPI00361A52EF
MDRFGPIAAVVLAEDDVEATRLAGVDGRPAEVDVPVGSKVDAPPGVGVFGAMRRGPDPSCGELEEIGSVVESREEVRSSSSVDSASDMTVRLLGVSDVLKV